PRLPSQYCSNVCARGLTPFASFLGRATSAPMQKTIRTAPERTTKRRRASPKRAPRVGFVSLGCPKALVDSERIITKLRAEGYELSADYAGADVVVVNTCG